MLCNTRRCPAAHTITAQDHLYFISFYFQFFSLWLALVFSREFEWRGFGQPYRRRRAIHVFSQHLYDVYSFHFVVPSQITSELCVPIFTPPRRCWRLFALKPEMSLHTTYTLGCTQPPFQPLEKRNKKGENPVNRSYSIPSQKELEAGRPVGLGERVAP